MPLQVRRGSDLDRQGIVFADGEPAWVQDTKLLWMGDGTTLGGIGIAAAIHTHTTAAITDIQITSVQDADVLRYSASASKWVNVPQTELVDGGNF
jgi:hypothetical protein